MKRVLITGAASGIGAETAAQLRRSGAQVLGLDLRGDGDRVLACDVRDQAAVEAAVADAVSRLGGLDVLVNSAGIGTPQSAARPPGPEAQAVLDVNLVGPWRVAAAALPALRESRGRVVNIASGLAHVSVPFGAAYCMSKHGLVAYSDALRQEVGHEVTVTTVYPGFVRTPIHAASREQGFGLEGLVPPERLEAVAARIARAAVGPPRRDVATSTIRTVSYAIMRRLPRRLLDALVMAGIRRAARRGAWDESELARDLVRALRG